MDSPIDTAQPASPHSWWGLGAGIAALCFGAAVAIALVGQFVQTRPLDLTELSNRTAQAIKKVLAANNVPDEFIGVKGPVARHPASAHWDYFEYDVRLPAPLSVTGIERLIVRRLGQLSPEMQVRNVMEGGRKIGIDLTFGGYTLAQVKLTALPAPVEHAKAEAPNAKPQTKPEIKPQTEPETRAETTAQGSRVRAGERAHEAELSSGDAAATIEHGTELLTVTIVDKRSEPPLTASDKMLVAELEGLGLVAAADRLWLEPNPGVGRDDAQERAPLERGERAPHKQTERARLAIIIDDGGYGGPATEAILKLSPKLTLAILPNTPHGTELARTASELGFEVLLHMPMENTDPTLYPHEGQLEVGMGADTIRALTESALAQVPGAVGINNHMGSRFTSDPKAMSSFMDAIDEGGLFFVDSRTTPDTRAYAMAAAYGVRAAQRDLFLDHDNTSELIRERFKEVLEVARERGSAIAIGHFRPNTAAALTELVPTLETENIELVHVSELVR